MYIWQSIVHTQSVHYTKQIEMCTYFSFIAELSAVNKTVHNNRFAVHCVA